MTAVCSWCLFAQTKVDTLTNEKIVNLSKIGLEPSVIIKKIQSSITKFDVSTDALIILNKNGVDGKVINEMMKVNDNQAANEDLKDLNNPNVWHKEGIYYWDQSDKETRLKLLKPTPIGNFASGGGGYGGYGGRSSSASLAEPTSNFQIYEANPTFYFYLKVNKESSFESSSPNDVTLVKLIVKKDKRIFIIGKSSHSNYGGSSSSGIPEKDQVRFESTEINDGIYKIHFSESLSNGEYGFLYGGRNNMKIMDFTIIKD